jgi:hypothetical protein
METFVQLRRNGQDEGKEECGEHSASNQRGQNMTAHFHDHDDFAAGPRCRQEFCLVALTISLACFGKNAASKIYSRIELSYDTWRRQTAFFLKTDPKGFQ